MSDERSLDLLETKIDELRQLHAVDGIDLSGEIARLEEKLTRLRRELYANLTEWERVKIARHPQRPYALDYIAEIFTEFYELHGDRMAGDDRALLVGLARLSGQPVVLLVQQKGRTTDENAERYFGMPRPQGYRKAVRAMKLAERFGFPVISLVDTPGAYPGVESEEMNIGGAIAECLLTLTRLKTPVVSAIIGEGGSGGALAISVADRVLMLENAVYSVISPEGAAAILWKDKEKTREAAAALHLTAEQLHEAELVDEIIPEPLGGAHKNVSQTAAALGRALESSLDALRCRTLDELVDSRFDRYREIGPFRSLDVAQEEMLAGGAADDVEVEEGSSRR